MTKLTHTYTNLTKSRYEGDAVKALARVSKKISGHQYGFFEPLFNGQKEIQQTQTIVEPLKKAFKNFVIFGTGGSSLGGKTLAALKLNPFASQHVHFLDNVDPYSLEQLFDAVDLKHTAFVVISKSGATTETLCQLLCLLEHLKAHGMGTEDFKKHIVIITESRLSPLRRLGQELGCPLYEHDPHIGGRFSVFSVVGLVPAALCGINIKTLLKGAYTYLQSDLKPVLEGSLFQYHHLSQGHPMTVMMPYVDRLKSFTAWFCQLWAESLGKNGKGSTPIQALGTVDQHSQLQLYHDGPSDKVFTLIYENTKGKGQKVSSHTQTHNSLSYLEGRSMGDLLEAELYATATSLSHVGPVRLISFDALDEETLGELLCHFMLETIVMAELMHINAFDQPGVEESKILTRKFLEERYAS